MRKLSLLVGVVLLCIQAIAQQRTITGKITDEKGEAIPNANVTVKGTNNGTITKMDGSYSLTIPPEAKILVISSIGMENKTISIGEGDIVNANLSISNSNLDEVVVVGYQTLRKKEVTGSVSNISNKEIAQKPIVNFGQLLQGKSSGLQITGEGGRPGANAIIRIRGTGSINASSEPLIILDGVQISATAFSLINANDIEDISVLKDAAASAIYGSRAANGVLVLTTKKGRSGKPELRYSFQYGKSSALQLKNLTLMNSLEKLQYEYEFGWQNPDLKKLIDTKIAAGSLPASSTISTLTEAQRQQTWQELAAAGAGDWRKYYLPDATSLTHELALSGGAEKFRYFLSLSKNNNPGVMYGSFFNRVGGRLNIEYQALDWFKVGTNLSVTSSKEDLKRELVNTQSSYTALYFTNPYEPVYGPNGKYNLTQQGFSPLEGADNNPNVRDRISSFTTAYGEAKFFKYLALKTQIGINYNTLKGESYLKPGSNLANILTYNQKNDYGNQDFNYVFTNTANWNQTIATNHSINILAGQEFNKNKFYSYSLTARNFPSASLTTLDNAGTPTVATTSRSEFSLISYFGSVLYNYNKKYYLSLSARRDGSSRFGKNNKFANFWSAGLAWDMHEENFLKTIPAISTLKLKGSIGTAGNNNIGNYDNLGVYSLTAKYNDGPAAVPSRLANPDLTWETNKTYDIGIEYGLFDDRITGSFDYYGRKTIDLLYGINISQTTGFPIYNGNIGNLKNTGYEFEITGNIIKKKDFNWSLSFSYSNNDNKVTSLYSDDVPFGPGSLGRFKIGEPLYTFFLVKSAGVNPANGKAQYYKKDGSITEVYSGGDAVLLKGKTPLVKYFGSVSTNISYKGFDVSAQLYYSGGNYIMNYQYQNGVSNGESINNPQFTEAFDYWKKAGDKTKYPNLKDPTQQVNYDTDQYLEKGNYISLRDVTLGYSVNSKLTQKIKVKGFRLFVQGTNLFIATKFHGLPEIGQANLENANGGTPYYAGQASFYAYPQIKAFTFGADIRF